MKGSGLVPETPVSCYKQLLCGADELSPVLSLEAVAFCSEETCCRDVVKNFLQGQGTTQEECTFFVLLLL